MPAAFIRGRTWRTSRSDDDAACALARAGWQACENAAILTPTIVATYRGSRTMQTAVGFIGLGVMGTPMALNLARAGTP
ncbi:NAD(P)-binding domain-containing protein, partial [Burkholderia cenocepacia]